MSAGAGAAIAALPEDHPDARILFLAAAVTRAEEAWRDHHAAVERGEADPSDEAADRFFEPMTEAIVVLIREPAHTIEGMLAKARVAMRHSLTWYTQIGETLPATPEEGYADIAGDEFDPDAAVVSLWADLERLAARGQS